MWHATQKPVGVARFLVRMFANPSNLMLDNTFRNDSFLVVDATASREAAWDAAKATTDALFTAIPGGLDVGLAVHGGSKLHTWTKFT